MTEGEKQVYNTFLMVKRTEQDKPFRFRKNWDKFEDGPDYPYVKKLHMFFKKFAQIKMESFFRAPYKVYEDSFETFDLKFYLTPRATKLYGIYMEKLSAESPDTEYQIKFIKESLHYMFKYCRDNNLTFESYKEHETGDVKTILLHIRDKHISPYVVYGIGDLGDILSEYSNEFLDFIAGKNFQERVALYRSRYYNSRKAKSITEQGITKLTKLLTN